MTYYAVVAIYGYLGVYVVYSVGRGVATVAGVCVVVFVVLRLLTRGCYDILITSL